MNLFHDGQRATKPSEYVLTSPDLILDVYQQAHHRGYTQSHQTIHLRKILTDGFKKLTNQLLILDPAISGDQIFSRAGNPVCFNYQSQFLRLALIKLLMFCLPPVARSEIDQPGIHFMDRIEYIPLYIKIGTYLMKLEAWDVILWFFWQVPIWSNFPSGGITGYRTVYAATLDWALDTWPDIGKYTTPGSYERATLGSTYYYNMAYHGLPDRDLITKFNKLLRRIYPHVEYQALITNKNYQGNPGAGHLGPVGHIIPPETGADAAANRYLIPYDEQLEYLLGIFNMEYGQTNDVSKINKFVGNVNAEQKQVSLNGTLAQHLTKLIMPGQTTKVKICFVSNKLTTYSSVFRDRIGVISGLDSRYFEVWIAVFKPIEYIFTAGHKIVSTLLGAFKQQGRIIQLMPYTHLRENQRMLAEYKFHIIYYPDLGMCQDYTLLAHARLAPIQITTWGHSDTSGNPSIDYFITSCHFENTDDLNVPRANYSEKPILLNSMGTYYMSPRAIIRNIIDPGFESGFQSAVRLGFPANAIIIGVLQSFFKFTPEFEMILGKLLIMTANNSRPVVLALSNSLPFNKIHLERLQQHFKNHTERVFWFQNKLPEEWLNLVSVCHIMLDPFPFGGCNTSLEAFDYNIPVVCKPSNQINGRFTAGFYEVMGVPYKHCCANTNDEYLQLTYKLVTDEYYYRMVKEKIKINVHKLFEQHESLSEYQALFMTLVERHHSNIRAVNILHKTVSGKRGDNKVNYGASRLASVVQNKKNIGLP